MPERRIEKIIITIEPTLLAIVQGAASKDGESVSSYGRRILIEKLQEQELLSDKMLLQIVE